MKKHLNFDPKFRREIESGQYKVETKSGLPVTILDWELKNSAILFIWPTYLRLYRRAERKGSSNYIRYRGS